MNGRGAVHLGGGGLTPGVKLLIVANAVAYLLLLVYIHWIPPQGGAPLFDHLVLFPRTFFSGEVWQLVTYMFLHSPGDPMHILFNLFILWMFGSLFEPVWGTRRFLTYYFACGLGGGVAVVLMSALFPETAFFQARVLGASAAVLGYVIAFSVVFPDRYVYLFFMIPIQARYIGIATVVGDLLANFVFGGRIASQAHIGGMLTGYLILTGLWRPSGIKRFMRRMKEKREQRERRKRFYDAMRK